jgi:hypothetical protein
VRVFTNRMMTWRKFWSLSRRERIAALQAAALMTVSRAGLRVVGLARWKAILAKFSSPELATTSNSRSNTGDALDRLPEIVRMNAGAARHSPFHPTCLERSLSLWYLLRRRGFDPEIQLGGRTDGGCFEAHAWVECDGAVLGDGAEEHDRFARFAPTTLSARQVR